MVIAYLVNQYPKVSHSFIRREIAALEAQGIPVVRYSIRSCSDELVDDADQQELEKTSVLLAGGIVSLAFALFKTAVLCPTQFWKAGAIALKFASRAQQGQIRHLAYLAEACLLRDQLVEKQIEHLHVHFGTNSATVAVLCRALGGPPYSMTVHGPEEFDRPEALSLPDKIHQAAFVVGVSSFGKSQLFRWCDLDDWNKIHVVHCGVDDRFLTATPTLPGDRCFVCVGRLSEQKGHLLLIQAAAQLAAEGLDFRLVLVGDGPLRSQIEALIAQFHLQNHIEITGWASGAAVQAYLQQATAFVLPSFAEGLPVVLMEALALGRPVISTYVAGIPELVEAGVSGWLVPPGSVNQLVAAMRAALQTPPERLAAMGAAGRKRVLQQHNASTEAQKLAALLTAPATHSTSLDRP